MTKVSKAGLGIRLPTKRSKTGCLCCRLRKKKCDERKPTCRGCERSKLICSWPSGNGRQPTDPDTPDFAWRLKLKSGAAVSHDITEQSSSAPLMISTDRLRVAGNHNSKFQEMAMIFPLSVNHDADDLIKDSFSGRIFDYYRHTTCPSMVARNHVRNPYIYSVLPMAHSNRLIMHLVLALGGLQAGHAWGSPEATHFAIQNYMTAIKEFKTALTSWVSGVQGNFLCLLLATTLLSQYECVSGNKEGAIFHHLRASREFVEHALNSPSSVNDHDTLKFCLEVYSYFELHAKLRLPARDSTAQDVQTVTACLEFLDGNQTSGFLFGCAWDLYKLIPTVSDFRVLQQRELAGENEVGADELYEELVGRLYNWKAPTPNVDSDRDNSGWTTAEISAAMILQNVLIIMLQTLHCPGRDSMTLPTDSLERIIDHTLSLYDRVNGTSVGAVTYWPLMVLGFYSQTAKQRDAVRRIIQDKIEVERKGLPILDRALEVLSWVWEESEQGVIGLECLEVVLMRRDTDICVG